MTLDGTGAGIPDDGADAALAALLRMDRSTLVETERGLFRQLAGRDSGPIVLFGAGGLGRRTLAQIAHTGLQPLCFADNGAALQGTVVSGLAVLSAADAVERYGDAAVFVVTVYIGFEAIIRQLNELGAKIVVPFFALYWKYPDLYLPHYVYDLPHRVIDAAPEVHRAGALLSDAASRREYLSQVWWRLDPSAAIMPPHAVGAMYFPTDLVALRNDEVFVDCGAYDGDTLLTFLNQSGGGFREAYAFEPDPRNVTRLESALAGLPESARSNIQLQAIAVGNVSGSVGMLLSDAASSVAAAGDVTVPCEPLDAVLERTTPTYLKMDIEGAEIDALDGARSLISANRPVLAISAYHFQDHIWAIPLLVESMVDGYRYHLRRYTSPPNDNLVVYAIPEERWIGGHARTANVES